jgi:hypothetical protein
MRRRRRIASFFLRNCDDPAEIDVVTDLAQRLKVGPAVLLLGQDYLRSGRDSNPFFDLLRERYPDVPGDTDSLRPFLGKLTEGDKSAILAWLHRRSQKIPINESLTTISEFAWNHVYTSAIDEVWVRAFAKNWRSLYSIFTEKSWPQDIRDRHRLCSSFLFGCVDKEDDQSRIPREELELDERLHVAVALLHRLPEILTPRGVLVLDGWNPVTDWLQSKDLYPALNLLGPSQVYVFGLATNWQSDTRLARLKNSGILHFVEKSLAETLNSEVANGVISLGDPGAFLPNGRQITIDSKLAFIPKDIFLEIEPFAVVLDDNLTLPPRRASSETEYFDYLRFLEEPVKLRNWEPYARGFPFQRDFYHALVAQIEECLTRPHANRAPILLHGDTGTGKSVALAHLAYHIASQAQFPVVFIERSGKTVEWRKLDRFLNWAEDSGAEASLVVWDGMRQVDDYTRLWTRLADRGRKTVVVGSTYHLQSNEKQRFSVEAGRLFNPQERDRFLAYLEKRAPEVASWIQQKKAQIDECYLVALYRLLPPARPAIRVGVVQEFQTEQQSILQRINNLPQQTTGFNPLAAALEAAGKLDLPYLASEADEKLDWSTTTAIHGETLTTLQKLFALVMTPGRYGCRMPIELLLAALNQPTTPAIIECLKTDVLVWHEESNGNLFVEPRQPLEAQIYIDTLFGGRPEPEAELICEMIGSLPRPDTSDRANTSIDFILELLQLIGPNSKIQRHKDRFDKCTLRLARALQEVRQQRNVLAPNLMLQEATFYREGIKRNEDNITRADKILMLEGAVAVLEQALELPFISSWQQSMIGEERTACLGTLINSQIGFASREHIRSLYISAIDAFRKARSAAPNNVHAVVTLGWITRPLIAKSFFGTEEQSEIVADLVSIFDEAEDISMDVRQQEFFLPEKASVMELLGRTEISDEAFEKLRSIGSKAGYYLRARTLFNDIPEDASVSDVTQKLSKALSYLHENWINIEADLKCVGLYFTLWWRTVAGKKPFESERQLLPFNDAQWNRCHELTDRIYRLADGEPRPTILFLRALAKFHIGQFDPSEQEFRQLANDNSLSVGGRRLRKLFVASRENRALEFDGQVRHDLSEHELGRIWVNQTRSLVGVVPRDFDKKQLRRGETLNDFHIAFSFTGAIAQPQHFLRNR